MRRRDSTMFPDVAASIRIGHGGQKPGTRRLQRTPWDTGRSTFWLGKVADAEGFEPTTSASGGQRSIQLSYASFPVFFGVK